MPPSWVLLTNTVEIQTVYCDCMLVIELFKSQTHPQSLHV